MNRRRLTPLLAAAVSVLSTIACSPPEPVKTTVRIGVTATANEPITELTPSVVNRLNEEIDRGEVRLVVYHVDGDQVTTVFNEDFTVRRPGGARETDRGLRKEGFDKNVERVQSILRGLAAKSGQLDPFDALATMGRTPGPALVVVHSSGLQTAGQLALTASGLDFDVNQVIEALPSDALPNLSEKKVVFSGLGQVAGPQHRLPESRRQALERLWLGVCAKFQAASCELDGEPTGQSAPPSSAAPVPVVEIGDVTTVVPQPTGKNQPTEVITVPSSILFEPDTDVLAPGAGDVLQQVAAKFKNGTSATAVGHTATYGPRDSAVELSKKRANRVVAELVSKGVSASAFTEITGVGYDAPIEQDLDAAGNLIPRAAERNRVVVLTLTESVTR